MSNKKVIGSFRLVQEEGYGYRTERSSSLDRATQHVFLSMLIEQFAHEKGISPENYAAILIDIIKRNPMDFGDESHE